jgi:glycosyltransferase involved in cell wall biosynthesis
MKKTKISVLVPVYKGAQVLDKALQSIYNQTYDFFEVIVSDDTPPEEKVEIAEIKKICDQYPQLKYIKNAQNLGCQLNFQVLLDEAKTDLVIYLAQDDIFSKNALEKVVNAFEEYPEAAFVTRPYFWFETDIKKPVRHVPPLSTTMNVLMHLSDGEVTVKAVFGSVGQISGLAFRKNLIQQSFHPDIFPGHIYPIADLLKRHPGIFLKDYIVAIGIEESQSRKISSVYDDSPTLQWLRMFESEFHEKKYQDFKRLCYKHILTNYEGLVQLKNFARPGILEKEIKIMIENRWMNIWDPRFIFYALITTCTPKSILRPFTDWYKRDIVAKSIPAIHFEQ